MGGGGHEVDLGLYLGAVQSPNRLDINGGDGTFSEEAAAFGLNFVGVSITMAFADYDRDGDLDAYLLTNSISLALVVASTGVMND